MGQLSSYIFRVPIRTVGNAYSIYIVLRYL